MAKGITITETLENGSVNTETQEVADVKNVFVRHMDENSSEVFYQNAADEMISLGMKAGMVSVSFGDLAEAQTETEEPKKTKKKK
tara:strand:+ start:692 stop:946 length:255 start_codon:yes stop_codon:yes gene_type:complete